MFLNLAAAFAAANPAQPRESVFLVHPLQLERWLEEAWVAAAVIPPIPGGGAPFLGSGTIVDDLDFPTQPTPNPLLEPSGIALASPDRWSETFGPQSIGTNPSVPFVWHHLMYAYLVESTGVFEILGTLVQRLLTGEALGALSPAGVKWLRSTEALFFRDPPSSSIASVVSALRPYERVNRRQVYWRMFGFDLPHAIPPGVPDSASAGSWKEAPGLTANRDFRDKWTELLRQVWIGIENRTNAQGAKPTDNSYLVLLCDALRDMMGNRRRAGFLAREEFAYVAVMSWFHLSIQTDTPIVTDLKATATFEDERLSQLAARVGMTPARRTRELLQLAEPVSTILRAIEFGLFDTAAKAELLYDPPGPISDLMNKIINLWQSATGDRVKDKPVVTVQTTAGQPLRIPKPAEPALTNGSR